jgi:hypothetical protein
VPEEVKVGKVYDAVSVAGSNTRGTTILFVLEIISYAEALIPREQKALLTMVDAESMLYLSYTYTVWGVTLQNEVVVFAAPAPMKNKTYVNLQYG